MRVVDQDVQAPCELRRVGLFGLDAELERYLRRGLAECSPRLSFTRASGSEELLRVRQQLWLCASLPPPRMPSPVLWLDGLSAEAVPQQLGPGVWRISAPFTVLRLWPAIGAALRDVR